MGRLDLTARRFASFPEVVMSQVFKVLRGFRNFEEGAVISQDDAPDADFPWLVKVGTVRPLSVGSGINLMAAAALPTELAADVQTITDRVGVLEEENAKLKVEIAGAKDAMKDLTRAYEERGTLLTTANANNADLLASWNDTKGKKDAAEAAGYLWQKAAEKAGINDPQAYLDEPPPVDPKADKAAKAKADKK